MYGCNLACPFCDEPKHKDASLIEETSIDEMVDLAKKNGTKWVCISGGEPTLHDLRPLIGALQGAGFKVQIETNGYMLGHCDTADLVTCSPKEDRIPVGRIDELKIIIPAQEHLLSLCGDYNTYLQPENYEHEVNMDNVGRCLTLIGGHPEFGLSVQLHKLLGVE